MYNQLTTDGSFTPLSQTQKAEIKPKINEKAVKTSSKRDKYRQQITMARVIHRPTYCVITSVDTDGNPIQYKRHALSQFKVKNELQSKQSKTKMVNAINWMLLFAEKKNVYSKIPYVSKKGDILHNFSFRLSFITLTLSDTQKHSDDYIKEHMLQPFLYWITRYYNASYVWKAETQLNGNIHFHLTIDTFIHWRSIRGKWNGILQTHGYCKTFQDGSNDKGNAATQIKAIKNERQAAQAIGGYLTKGSIEEKNYIEKGKDREKKLQELMEKIKAGNYITYNETNKMHYTRFVKGRLWGCSKSLSKIKCFIDQMDINIDFEKTEHDFFHDNKLQNLGKKIFKEQKEKHQSKSYQEQQVLQVTDEDLNRKLLGLMNVYIHKNLKWCKIPPELAAKIHQEKLTRNFNTQKNFTIESLL